MSKFNLKEFLGELCKKHTHLEKLYSIIKKYKFENVLANRGQFTFIMPKSSDIDKLLKKDAKSAKKKLLSIFVPGKYSSVNKWPETINGVGGIKYNIKAHTKTVEVNRNKIEYLTTTDSIPVWNIVGTIKKGGAFKPESDKVKPENFFTSPEFDVILKSGGLKNLVAAAYDALDSDAQTIADCFMNHHPLAELFLIYDSPFINAGPLTLEVDTIKSERYNEICNKTGSFLINSKDDAKVGELDNILKEASIIDDKIDEFYSDISESGKYEINDKSFNIVCPQLAPYLQRISLFVYMMNDYQKVIDDEESTNIQKYDAFVSAFTLNATTNLKLSYEELKENIKDEEESLKKNIALYKVCGLILFKSSKTIGAKEKKAKKKRIIQLTPATRKILTSSASSNK